MALEGFDRLIATVSQRTIPTDTQIASEKGGTSFTVGQVSITDSATLISDENTSRKRLVVVQHGTTAVYLGASNVTTANGLLLTGTAGYPMVLRTTAAIYGIVASGSQTVSYLEEVI